MTRGHSFAHQKIDDNTIFGMDHYQSTYFRGTAQYAVDSLIIDHEGPRIGHQELERGHACGDHVVHSGLGGSGKIRDGDVETIVNDGFPIRFVVPGLQCIGERMAALLVREIDDGRGATAGGGNSSCLKIVAGNRSRERKLHMCMHIDGTREDILTLGIQDCINLQRGKRTWYADGGNFFSVNEDIALVICNSSDNMAIRYERRSEEHTSELQSPCNLVC